MASFADQMRAVKAVVRADMDTVMRFAIEEAGRRIIARSPVGEEDGGAFRSNWNYSLEAPDYSTTKAIHLLAVNFIDEIPKKGAAGFRHFICNGIPYGYVIEVGRYPNPPKGGRGRTIGGFSTQAPHGVVGLTQVEWPNIVREAVARVAVTRGLASAIESAEA